MMIRWVYAWLDLWNAGRSPCWNWWRLSYRHAWSEVFWMKLPVTQITLYAGVNTRGAMEAWAVPGSEKVLWWRTVGHKFCERCPAQRAVYPGGKRHGRGAGRSRQDHPPVPAGLPADGLEKFLSWRRKP